MKRYVNLQEGKSLGKGIFGKLLKFPPGQHAVEVTAVSNFPDYVKVLFSLPSGHLHTEDFEANPGLSPLQTVLVTVGHGPGYITFRLPDGRFQARDAETGEDLTPAVEEAQDLLGRLSKPQSQPQIKEIRTASGNLEFKLYKKG